MTPVNVLAKLAFSEVFEATVDVGQAAAGE